MISSDVFTVQKVFASYDSIQQRKVDKVQPREIRSVSKSSKPLPVDPVKKSFNFADPNRTTPKVANATKQVSPIDSKRSKSDDNVSQTKKHDQQYALQSGDTTQKTAQPNNDSSNKSPLRLQKATRKVDD